MDGVDGSFGKSEWRGIGAAPLREPWFQQKLFQSLENARKIFPIIGKIFSNHWKTRLLPPSYQIGQTPAA
jgi:hypothetical protein